MEDTDKEASQSREQAENGITLWCACSSLSLLAKGPVEIVRSEVTVKVEIHIIKQYVGNAYKSISCTFMEIFPHIHNYDR